MDAHAGCVRRESALELPPPVVPDLGWHPVSTHDFLVEPGRYTLRLLAGEGRRLYPARKRIHSDYHDSRRAPPQMRHQVKAPRVERLLCFRRGQQELWWALVPPRYLIFLSLCCADTILNNSPPVVAG